jgi:hypothetical protein
MKIKSFKEYYSEDDDISEQAIAMYGDWEPARDRVAKQSMRSLKSDWTHIDSVKIETEPYLIYKYKNEHTYMIGNVIKNSEDVEEFIVILQIELRHQPSIEHSFKGQYPNLYNVDGVMVKENKRGKGLGTFMYQYLNNKLNITLLGDENQYFKARLLWSKLSRLDNVIVDIVDIDNGIVLDTNVTLHHGEGDWEFDERVWSYTNEKKDIRLVLREVL